MLFANMVHAQTTRSLEGLISLDVAPAVRDLTLDIIVNNHSFVVLPPPFGILRPIQSSVSTRIQILEGQTNANYVLDGIIDDPVDYTVQIRCLGCSDIIANQSYTPSGNRPGFPFSAFIDPDDLAPQLNLTALTRAVISGQIVLRTTSERDLSFSVTVSPVSSPSIILAKDDAITIAAGASTAVYQLTGLARTNSAVQVNVRCNNCLGVARRTQAFERTLFTQTNHRDIDFTLADEGRPNIPTAIYLLLLD